MQKLQNFPYQRLLLQAPNRPAHLMYTYKLKQRQLDALMTSHRPLVSSSESTLHSPPTLWSLSAVSCDTVQLSESKAHLNAQAKPGGNHTAS